MRRDSGGFEVPIVAPTLGLITRVSTDEPDVRAAAVASNVRFEKGVVKNANGFKTMTLTPALDSPATLVYQTQFYNPSMNVGIVGTARYLYSITAPVSSSVANLFSIYDFGSNKADIRNRIIACSFFNKVLFAQPDSQLLDWTGSGQAVPAIGLDPTQRWQGVNVFREYVVAWNDSIFQWCATDDATCWIPVAQTATSALLNTTEPFTIPVADGVTETGWIYVDSLTAALLAVQQFMSMIYGGTTTYFQVTATIPSTGNQGQVAGFTQIVPVGAQKDIFINSFNPYVTGGQLQFQNNSAVLTVVDDAVDPGSYVTALAAAFTVPMVGSSVTVATAATPSYTPGTYVSVGVAPNPGTDIYLVQSVDLINDFITLQKIGVGFTNATVHQVGEFIVPQPSVTVVNNSGVIAQGSFITPLLELNGFQATVQNLTGVLAAGTVIPIGTQILSVDANGAGQLVNAGALVNGPILWFDTLGDYGFIFKNRSIQSVQYVGIDQGTFFIRPEVTDEGLIGNYSFCKVGLDTMYIFGNKEFYRYAGGKQLIPIGRQHAVEVFAELDRSRTNEIIGYHNEASFEVWFAYPVVGGAATDTSYRVFIYNYVEDSCTIDDYDPSVHPNLTLHGITAVGRLDLSPNIPWTSGGAGTWAAPTAWPAADTWQNLKSDAPLNFSVGGFLDNTTVGGPTLALLNTNYDRDGNAMLCTYESVDFSAQDPVAWKYHDTLMIALQVVPTLVPQPNPYVIKVQIGSRNNLDTDLVWSNWVTVQVQGDGQAITKANIKRSGRYLRIRISSNQVGCGWRISRLTPMGRLGKTY
jgi:hypothetical protein